jgi:regulator of PEP synthase PpsR (kinase-PPPase family)
MTHLHLHLLSDSTGETLENIVKAAVAQFENVETIRHFWPMVRSDQHLDRIVTEIGRHPGLVLFTLANPALRKRLEKYCRAMGLPFLAPLDNVTDALSNILGQETTNRPGRKHILDEEYFARIDAIQFTIAHDDGIGSDNWEEADIVLAGVSRTSKTPTAIYLANRGFKTANIPIVPGSPPPPSLFRLKHPMVVGLTTNAERLVQVRRNRLLSLNQAPATPYVDLEQVQEEVSAARRIFADQGWPIIDVSRRSIEEAAAAIISLYQEHVAGFLPGGGGTRLAE